MSEATDKLILAQLKRIADALDRAHPKPSDMTFDTPRRLVEPNMVPPQHPGTIAPPKRTGELGKWGEGDWVLEDDDHTGEETE